MGDDPNPNPDGQPGGDGFKAITTQEEFNAALKDRLARERAKFSDYDDLKAKATQFDAAQEASQSEAEKTAAKIAKLEQELQSTQTAALRSRIQAKHGISDEDAALFLTAIDEATLTKQAERLAETANDRKKNGNRDPFAGRTPSKPGDDSMREGVRALFGRD